MFKSNGSSSGYPHSGNPFSGCLCTGNLSSNHPQQLKKSGGPCSGGPSQLMKIVGPSGGLDLDGPHQLMMLSEACSGGPHHSSLHQLLYSGGQMIKSSCPSQPMK